MGTVKGLNGMEDDRLIIEKLLHGYDLGTVMTPDDEIPSNKPLHDEHFELPHVIAAGSIFYGITPAGLFTVFEKNQFPVSFYYSNLNGIFGSFSPESIFNSPDNLLRFNIASKKRYKRNQWIVKKNSRLIWEFNGNQDTGALREAVNSARRLSVAFLDEENVWNIHPVTLPQMNRHNDGFVLKTHYTVYPYIFRDPQAMTALLNKNIAGDYFSNKKKYQAHLNIAMHHPFIAFYHLFGDSTYQSYYDLGRGDTTNKYSNLRIFAEHAAKNRGESHAGAKQ